MEKSQSIYRLHNKQTKKYVSGDKSKSAFARIKTALDLLKRLNLPEENYEIHEFNISGNKIYDINKAKTLVVLISPMMRKNAKKKFDAEVEQVKNQMKNSMYNALGASFELESILRVSETLSNSGCFEELEEYVKEELLPLYHVMNTSFDTFVQNGMTLNLKNV